MTTQSALDTTSVPRDPPAGRVVRRLPALAALAVTVSVLAAAPAVAGPVTPRTAAGRPTPSTSIRSIG